MITVRIFRNGKLNDFDPKDRATLKELKAALAKASDEMDDHPGISKYEAAYKAAEKAYNEFLDKAKTVKSNASKKGPYAGNFSDSELRDHYEALIGDGKEKKMSRAQLISALKGTEFDEHAYAPYYENAKEAEVKRLAETVIDEVLEPRWEDVVRIAKRLGYEKPIPARAWALIAHESRNLENAKFTVGQDVDYGPFTWKVVKIAEGRYFLKQVGGSGQTAQDVRETELSVRKKNAKEYTMSEVKRLLKDGKMECETDLKVGRVEVRWATGKRESIYVTN